MPRALESGLAAPGAAERLAARLCAIDALLGALRSLRLDGKTLAERLRRPEVRLPSLLAEHPDLQQLHPSADVIETVETELKYAGYIDRQQETVERMRRQETTLIPAEVDYGGLTGLAVEAREKLAALRPRTLGAAGRIEGVRPPDVALLAVHVERARRLAVAAKAPAPTA